MPLTPVIHIAGPDIQVGAHLRQRCGWCGAVLADYALDRVMVPDGHPTGRPPTWPAGELISIDGPVTMVVEHQDGAELPEGCCGKLDPAATA